MKEGISRSQLILVATALLVFVVVQVATAGGSGSGPTATASSTKSKIKSLNKRVAALEAQLSSLSGQVTSVSGKAGSPTQPTGPAGGDLTGTYPNPSLRVATGPISPGLHVASGFNNCGGTAMNNAWNTQPQSRIDVGYYRDIQGTVFLQGDALPCGTAPSLIYTLPLGFRPANNLVELVGSTGGASGSVLIGLDGTVRYNSGSGDVDFDGISFRCAPSGQNGCP